MGSPTGQPFALQSPNASFFFCQCTQLVSKCTRFIYFLMLGNKSLKQAFFWGGCCCFTSSRIKSPCWLRFCSPRTLHTYRSAHFRNNAFGYREKNYVAWQKGKYSSLLWRSTRPPPLSCAALFLCVTLFFLPWNTPLKKRLIFENVLWSSCFVVSTSHGATWKHSCSLQGATWSRKRLRHSPVSVHVGHGNVGEPHNGCHDGPARCSAIGGI